MRVRVRMLFKRGYASRASLPIPFMEWVVRERDDFTLGQDSFGGERRKEVLKGKHLPERKMVSSPKGQFISKLPRRKNHLEALSQKVILEFSGISLLKIQSNPLEIKYNHTVFGLGKDIFF